MKFQFEVLSPLILVGLAAAENVPYGSSWDYHPCDGQPPPYKWNNSTTNYLFFSETDLAPFGYGEDKTELRTDMRQPKFPRPSTYYFRRGFKLDDPQQVSDFDLRMEVDDGAIVYINGVEVARYNMALDVPDSNLAWAMAEEPYESGEKVLPLATCKPLNLAANNILAVSLHQAAPDSPDIRMDLSLTPRTGAAPAAVTSLTASAVPGYENRVELKWASRGGATDNEQYRILRQAKGDVAWEVISPTNLLGTSTSFTDEHVKPDTTYYYQMYVVNPVSGGRTACSQVRTYPDSVPALAQEEIVTTPGKSVSFTMLPTDPDTDHVTMSLIQDSNGLFTITQDANGVGTLSFSGTKGTDLGNPFKCKVVMTDNLSSTTSSVSVVVHVTKATTVEDCIFAVRLNCRTQCDTRKAKYVNPCIAEQSSALCTGVSSLTPKQVCPNWPYRYLRHSPNDDENLE